VKIGRIERPSPSGPVPRIAVVDTEAGVAVDAQRAEQARRLVAGDSPEAAARIAAALIPQSLAAGLGAAGFREDLERAVSARPPADDLYSLSWRATEDIPSRQQDGLPAGLEVLRFHLRKDAALERTCDRRRWLWTRHAA